MTLSGTKIVETKEISVTELTAGMVLPNCGMVGRVVPIGVFLVVQVYGQRWSLVGGIPIEYREDLVLHQADFILVMLDGQ